MIAVHEERNYGSLELGRRVRIIISRPLGGIGCDYSVGLCLHLMGGYCSVATFCFLLLLGLMSFGFSLGGKLGVLLVLSSIFVALFLAEPVSTFIESSIIKKSSNDDDTET